MEMLFVRGDGVILVRIFFSIVALLNTPYYSGITPFTYMTSVWQPFLLMLSGSARLSTFCVVKCNKPTIPWTSMGPGFLPRYRWKSGSS
jgi:hypothetical protein